MYTPAAANKREILFRKRRENDLDQHQQRRGIIKQDQDSARKLLLLADGNFAQRLNLCTKCESRCKFDLKALSL